MPYCPNCGTEVNIDDKYCERCNHLGVRSCFLHFERFLLMGDCPPTNHENGVNLFSEQI
jgi:hypothetical protein